MIIKPILFNTEMVRAILDGRKTVTRRCVKYKYSNTEMKMHIDKYGTRLIEIQKDVEGETFGKNPDGSTWRKLLGYVEPKPPYKTGDILYVRETWHIIPCIECGLDEYGCCYSKKVEYEDGNSITEGCFVFKKDYPCKDKINWRPSIHMPKEAARIFLKVKDVRVERLQDITEEQAKAEGANWKNGKNVGFEEKMRRSAVDRFAEIWNSTIKKTDIDRYGWDASPWVWVIEFEQCEKPEGWW